MSNVAIILQIMGITIGMVILGMVLNKILGISREKITEFKDKALNINERMKNAQIVGDIRMLTQIRREVMELNKQIMLKQFVPLCLRCVIFLGIFAILGFIYAGYIDGLLPFPILIFGNGWVAVYFIFSISFSLIIWGMKKLYLKMTGKTISGQGNLREIMDIVSPREGTSGISFQISGTDSSSPSRITTVNTNIASNNQDESNGKPESWKDRIEK